MYDENSMSAPSQRPPAWHTDELADATLNNLQFHPGKSQPNEYETGGYANDTPAKPILDYTTCPSMAATLTAEKHANPMHGVELQASDICPKNFIILDQTDKGSRIMFHPAMAHKFPSLDLCTIYGQEQGETKESSLKEDTKDIDALMSLDEEEEEVSTGRTLGNCGSRSSDSSSSTGSSQTSSKLCKSKWSGSLKPYSATGGGAKRRRERMQRMVTALRGIVPGGERMDTTAVLNEAVKYLKSLKVEVKKLGIGK